MRKTGLNRIQSRFLRLNCRTEHLTPKLIVTREFSYHILLKLREQLRSTIESPRKSAVNGHGSNRHGSTNLTAAA